MSNPAREFRLSFDSEWRGQQLKGEWKGTVASTLDDLSGARFDAPVVLWTASVKYYGGAMSVERASDLLMVLMTRLSTVAEEAIKEQICDDNHDLNHNLWMLCLSMASTGWGSPSFENAAKTVRLAERFWRIRLRANREDKAGEEAVQAQIQSLVIESAFQVS